MGRSSPLYFYTYIIMINFENIQKELTELYKKKNEDYGNSFEQSLNEYGLLPTIIRLKEKIARADNIYVNNAAKIAEESIEDTLKDIANYCIITLTWLKNKKIN